ncbi:MAG: type II secretion system F family protein [Acidimicrobiia bacterium]
MTELAIALLAATAVAAAVGLVIRPVRPLGARIRPYAQLSRSRMGRGSDVAAIALVADETMSSGAAGDTFGPMVRSVADALSRLVDAGGEDDLLRRLRAAGMNDVTPEAYRMRQLGYLACGTAGGVTLGVLLGGAAMALFFGTLGAVWGATVMRSKLGRATRERCALMRTELYTVAQMIAMYLRAGRGSVQAVQALVDRGNGPVVDELREALAWMSGGRAQADAYDDLAATTAEPAAARLYRMLADAARAGGDLADALLSVSDDLRNDRREDLERMNTKRRGAMLFPTIAVMAPVVILWVVAPIPSMLLSFGK